MAQAEYTVEVTIDWAEIDWLLPIPSKMPLTPIWVSPMRESRLTIKRSPNCKPPILGITTTTPEGRYQSWRHEP